MTNRIKTVLIVLIVVLLASMALGVGLTAAIWDSSSGGTSSGYGPDVKTLDWNSWDKYFDTSFEVKEGNATIGYAVKSYDGTNLPDVIFPISHSGVAVIQINNTVFDDDTKKSLPVNVYISPLITSIQPSALSNLQNLQTITFADSGVYTNTSEQEVVVSGQTITVGAYALAGCTNLTKIVIEGDRVVKFKAYSLIGCTSLTRIEFGGTQAQWNAIVKDSGWDAGAGDFKIYCSDKTLNQDGTEYVPA